VKYYFNKVITLKKYIILHCNTVVILQFSIKRNKGDKKGSVLSLIQNGKPNRYSNSS